jgi:hypothetical protein
MTLPVKWVARGEAGDVIRRPDRRTLRSGSRTSTFSDQPSLHLRRYPRHWIVRVFSDEPITVAWCARQAHAGVLTANRQSGQNQSCPLSNGEAHR